MYNQCNWRSSFDLVLKFDLESDTFGQSLLIQADRTDPGVFDAIGVAFQGEQGVYDGFGVVDGVVDFGVADYGVQAAAP